ncbi:MAG: FAD-dependent oxidoreductase [Ruminococcaceae bacterium]|nr:FAD-dependent oxidoreductase [Oscillospiraceae bacterium]
MASLWQDTARLRVFSPFSGDTKTDVLIIGGGITGILCAHMLQNAGVDCMLVEAKRICSGITANTTAKITSQHGLFCRKLVNRFGREKTQMYLDANDAALEKYAQLCQSIDCDFERQDNFVYSLNDPNVLEKELDALSSIGHSGTYQKQLPLPFETAGAVKFEHQAQFHPLKFLSALSSGLGIYENTGVRELVGMTAVTDYGRIKADKIIVATHFPFLNKHGAYFLKLYQQRSYVLALENAEHVDGMYVDGSGNGMSFRNHGSRLLLGGGGHRTGKKGSGWDMLEEFAREVYPQSKEVYRWAAQDCMSLDDVPYIGQYSKSTPGLYVAAGYNKWGMTSSMAAAMILADMVQGKETPYADVFSPSRSILRTQLFVNGGESAVNLLTPSKKRCPHLGCALKWNPHEHSWDCPCHGSRFTETGKLIDNPATGDME